MKRAQIAAIRRRLAARAAKLVEIEVDAEGFWDDVAEDLGLDDPGLISAADEAKVYAEVDRLQRVLVRRAGAVGS